MLRSIGPRFAKPRFAKPRFAKRWFAQPAPNEPRYHRFGLWLTIAVLLPGLLVPDAVMMSRQAVLAQSTISSPDAPKREPTRASDTGVGMIDDILANLTAWIERANREYQAVVVNQLSVPTEKGLAAERAGKANPSPQAVIPHSAQDANQESIRPRAPQRTESAPTEQRQSELQSTDPATLVRQRSAEAARLAAANPAKNAPLSEQRQSPQSEPTVERSPGTLPVPPSAAKPNTSPDPTRTVAAPPPSTTLQTGSKPAGSTPSLSTPSSELATPAATPSMPKPEVVKPDAPKPDASSRPAALADAATKAGDAILRSLERGAPVAPDPKLETDADAAKDRNAIKVAGQTGAGRRCKNAGRSVDPPAYYIVKRGDTLWHISRRHYDKGYLFPKIVRANRGKLSDPDLIFPCQKVFLP